MKIFLDTSPLLNDHAIRGVGMYTKFLRANLAELNEVELVESVKDADIVHYPFFDFFAATLPLRSGKPRVVTIHDVIPLQFFGKYWPGVKALLKFLRQWLALRNVSAIITDSQASKKAIQHYLQIPEKKIFVTLLAVDPELRLPDTDTREKISKSLKLPEKYVLYVGDINYNKNLPQLIKSLKFLPDEMKLVCVGKNFYPHDIPEWRWIETQIALSDVDKRLMFLNEIGPDQKGELATIYHQAVAYIQPSLAEGFGLPVLEAMQSKVPVVCAKNSSLIEVAGDQAMMVQPEAEQLAEGVQVIANFTSMQRSAWVTAAAEWASKFTWQKTAKATKKVYEEVLASKIKKERS
jgi:glycosyltransferase involved in cell wall biosynthesis